ncbi:MAG TPA: prepilin-type N-terminal cleavage/methylation domain-containing protein [Acidimicrobiales bacterium]
MFTSYRNIMARKAAGEMDETGFTLIELLIVIVVLGILAGVVIFALGGVTGQSAIAACKADGATVSTALSAYNADNSGTPATQAYLLPTAGGGPADPALKGPFLQSWPSNGTHYAFALESGVLYLDTDSSSIATWSVTPTTTGTGVVAYTGPNMVDGTGAAAGCDTVS